MSALPAPVYSPWPATRQRNFVPGGFISEAEYWEKYYQAETAYEWKNGRLEEKPVSDWQTSQVYRWFLALLEYYLETSPVAQITLLDIGFRLALPDGVAIRKPDLAVVRNDNPVTLKGPDCTFRGIYDLCVEALSDVEAGAAFRDKVIKKGEYAAGGVPEYFILHHQARYQAFYFLGGKPRYQPLPAPDGIIRSKVLPGFQFRVADLSRQPRLEALRTDPIYQGFVLPAWRAAEQRASTAEQRASAAEQRAEVEAEARRWEEKARCAAEQRASAAEAEVARLRAALALSLPNRSDGK